MTNKYSDLKSKSKWNYFDPKMDTESIKAKLFHEYAKSTRISRDGLL